MKENQKIMTQTTAGSRKLKRSNLPKFNNDIYPVISSSSLVVYSVHYLLELGIEVKLEEVVFACFLLFPQKFALKKYPRWPDSAAISGCLSDCRSSGYVAANTEAGFKLTVKGSKLAEKVARVLGVSTARRAVKATPLKSAVIIKEKIIEPVKVEQVATPIKKISEPAKIAEVISPPPKAQIPKPIKKAKTARKKKLTLPVPVMPIKIAPISTQVKKKLVQRERVIQLDLIKVEPFQVKKESHAPVKQIETAVKKKQTVPVPKPAKKVKPVQVRKTKPAETVIVSPAKVVEKAKPAAPPPISKEAKERAGKFVRSMERSDAYIHYKKNGSKAAINEFDFRSLLLCTMESSAETLARNVELFKGYARIHNRQDLILFLNYCEDKFSHLLKPQSKPVKKLKK